MIKSVDSIENQKTLIVTVAALLSYNPIVSFVNTLTNLYLGEGFIYDTIVLYLILLYLILRASLIIYRSANNEVVVTFIIITVMIFFNNLIYPENFRAAFTNLFDFTSNPMYFFFYTIIGYFIMRNISNFKLLTFYFYRYSAVIVIISILNYFLLLYNGVTAQYMVVSYDSLFFVVFVSLLSFERKNILFGIIGIAGIIFIFTIGARGALISLLFSFFVYFIFKRQKLLTKILITIGILFVLFIVSNYFESFVYNFNSELESVNLQSKIVSSLVDDSFIDDSGRSDIQKMVLNEVTIFGNGLFGDRVLLKGGYAHNIFIEILSHWGYLFGILLIFFLLYLLFKVLVNRNKLSQILVVALLSSGFFKLLFSGSYLTEVNFGVLLGICVNLFILGITKKSLKNV